MQPAHHFQIIQQRSGLALDLKTEVIYQIDPDAYQIEHSGDQRVGFVRLTQWVDGIRIEIAEALGDWQPATSASGSDLEQFIGEMTSIVGAF